MNHLAHLFLAQPTVYSRTGNLMGDFARGVRTNELPEPMQLGLANHRAIDAFTDQHEVVAASRRRFSSQRRRFAGIALDVLYDHLLLRHWHRFATIDREAFIDVLYRDLIRGQADMPDRMSQVVSRMVEQDWFASYAHLDNVGYALDRVADRIRFKNRFKGVVAELRADYEPLENDFLEFFPDLVNFVESQALEAGTTATHRESTPWIRYT